LSNSRFTSAVFVGTNRATVLRTSIFESLEEVDCELRKRNKSDLSCSSNIVLRIAELSRYQLNSVPLREAP